MSIESTGAVAPETPAAPLTAADALNAAWKAAEAANATPAPVVDAAVEVPNPENPVTPKPDQAGDKKGEEPKPEDVKFAAKFAALGRREKEIRMREQRVAQSMKQMEDRLKQMEERVKDADSFDERLKTDPLGVLEKKGLSYKDLTEKFVLKPEETPETKQNSTIDELRNQVKALAERLEKDEQTKKTSLEQAQKQQIERAKQNYLNSLTTFVNDAGEKYELIRRNDAVNVVYEVMEEAFSIRKQEENNPDLQLTPEEIDVLRDQAAEAVEANLLEEAKKSIDSNKLKSLLGSTQPKPAPEPKKQTATLSNNMSQQVPTTPTEALSDDESKRLIAKMLKYNEN